jgi:SWI/SNF-related matrix-associated actin-dependent regulator 1 of chromatin subfamily A
MFRCTFENNRLIFHVDYLNRDRAKQAGAYWDAEKKVWYKDVDKMPDNFHAMIRDIRIAGFDIDESVAENISNAILKRQYEIVEIERRKVDYSAVQPEGIERELFPFQKAGVAFLEPLNTAILADDMGLGKTGQAIGWARNRLPCLVICPASLKINWMREIMVNRKDDTVALVNSNDIIFYKKGFQPVKLEQKGMVNADWIVINYDIIGGWLAWLCEQKFEAMIADECHYIKNSKSQRGNNCLLLSQAVKNRLAVTGTPILNRPTELFTLLQFIGKVEKKDFWWWRKRFCVLEEKKVPIREGSDYKRDENGKVKTRASGKPIGTKNDKELRNSMRCYFLRRLKSDVLKDLPPKLYQDHYVEITNRKDYDEAEAHTVEWIAQHEGEHRASIAARAIFLAKLNVLRQLCIKGKIDALKEIIENLKEQNKKAIIFSNYKEILTTLKFKLGKSAVLYTGDNPDQESIDKFQNDENTRWFLTTIKKGGVGLNLTECDTVIFIDLPWTPGDRDQATDRAHRIGQKNNVTVISVLGENTIDDMIVEILRTKQEIISKIVDGVDDNGVSESETLANIEKMFKKKFAKKLKSS